MEPDFTKKNIPDWFICDWFYFFFWLNLVIAVLYLIAMLMTMGSSMPKGARFPSMAGALVGIFLGATNMLFFYLICDRTLKPTTAY